ncbi:hypothetical protein J2Y38_000833 [Flavobacterium sp. 2755]|uniref:zinc-dependent metalloprotease n=1 Tax=Flavobacterium sp. 2755 TaxID=2817765 RepID=UPI00285A8BA9|nr:zinc-dependent metalloprotease [Flavobacterium sp. 2755]MDR6760635.1 hypothetical protein [Flavobacterium sp. 2755]
MKKNVIIIISFLITIFCSAQNCLTDEYYKGNKTIDPQLDKKVKEIISSFKNNETNETQKPSGTQALIGDEIIVIPVVFNVIHSGEPLGTGKNISLNKIEEQINILNDAYSGKYGGVDTRIRFCLAKQNTVGQATTGVNRFFGKTSYDVGIRNGNNCEFTFEVDRQIKRNISSGFPSSFYLNIWTTDIINCGKDNYLGYGTYPFYDDFSLDGIVLDYLQVGINVTTDPNDINYSNGSTLAHEAGHWLGLYHVFEGYESSSCSQRSEIPCDIEGDMICDTELVPNSGFQNIAPGNCLGYNCKGQIKDVVQNIMDYQKPSRYYCQTKFTAGQKRRMKSILSYYKPTIYNQGMVVDLVSCKSPTMGSGGGKTIEGEIIDCSAVNSLKGQNIVKPVMNQDFSPFIGTPVEKFGQRLEVNDKWLVTTFETYALILVGSPKPTKPIVNSLVIYKREGCKYALHQMIDIGFTSTSKTTDFGLLLNGNEIIVTAKNKDEVFICRLNENYDRWELVQQIKNESESEVGSSAYVTGRFLFILENNDKADNILRIYYKNNNGNYDFHQTFSMPVFSFTSYGKLLQSGNFKKGNVNFNSSTFTGSYDPPEILIGRNNSSAFMLLGLNSNNMWTMQHAAQPPGMKGTERALDIEISKDFIYVLTISKTGGTKEDILYLYSYKITDKEDLGTYPFQNLYNKQTLDYNIDGLFSDAKLQVFNDEFLFVDNQRGRSMRLFYNTNSGSTDLPNWEKKEKTITCSNGKDNLDDFEVFGNLLFYGYGGSVIHIYNISDILKQEGFDQTFINNTDFYDKKINLVPDNYSTSAQKITVGESIPIDFNYVEKELIANESIVLKPGTKISSSSKVKLKITDNYGLCNSILTSKRTNIESDVINDYLSEREDQNFYRSKEKVLLYPNPNSGIFTVYFGRENDKLVNCDIYDSTGHLLYHSITEKSSIEINLSNLPGGNYIIKLKGNNFDEAIKFIKQ